MLLATHPSYIASIVLFAWHAYEWSGNRRPSLVARVHGPSFRRDAHVEADRDHSFATSPSV